MLTELITNKKLAWDKNFKTSTNEYYLKLSDDAVNELLDNKNNLKQEDIILFPVLKIDILKIKKILLEEHGFIIIDGNSFAKFSKDEVKSIYIIISKFLGNLIPQNIKNEILIEVKDEGKSMKNHRKSNKIKENQ